ncbi:MAG: LysR family transcriptional regulator [Telmatospirillum sp.]|nr:LysR family transcriptional regulator [Telmatospirillum sp.]
MFDTLPSMEALRAFEAAARHSSFTAAAKELGLTQSAISRVVASLERRAANRLFERVGRGLILTEAGEAFARGLRPSLAAISSSMLDLTGYSAGTRDLTVSTLPTFGSHWLAPRLARFAKRHPKIRLKIQTRGDAFDFAESDADCAIFYGAESWPSALSDRLLDVSLIPVCAPGLLKVRRSKSETLANLPLLQHSRQPHAWPAWFRLTKRHHPAPASGYWFDTYDPLIRAATGGLGAALVRDFLVEREIADGSLVALHDAPTPAEHPYFFVYPEKKRMRRELQAFRVWLLQEARAVPNV